MRIFKGLENIHSVIDKHQAEWLREQGEEPVIPESPNIEENVRRRASHTGKLSASRFLDTPTPQNGHKEPEVEVVQVISQKDNRHSWLYNEVLKAVRDAAGDGRNTKVVAIFIPVVQNGEEFGELPVSETVTLSPVSEEDITPEEIEELITQEPETEEAMTSEPEQELEADIPAAEEPEAPEPEPEPEAGIPPQPEDEETETGDLPDFPEMPDDIMLGNDEEETPEAQGSNDEFVGDLLSEARENAPEEVEEIFREMEEKLQEQEASEPEQPEAEDSLNFEEVPSDEGIQILEEEPPETAEETDGQPMQFEEISLPELPDDDEIFDEIDTSGQGDDIELLPDPEDDKTE